MDNCICHRFKNESNNARDAYELEKGDYQEKRALGDGLRGLRGERKDGERRTDEN